MSELNNQNVNEEVNKSKEETVQPDITLDVVKSFIQDNIGLEAVQSFIEEKTKEFLETEKGKNLLQPKLDSFFSKGLESWKAKTLPNLIDEEVSKRNPAETPEQKRIRELEEKLNRQEIATQRSSVKANAVKFLSEKGMPTSVAEYLTFDTEAGARNAINNLELDWTVALDRAVTERLKGSGKTPSTGQSDGTDTGAMTKEKLLSMSVKESTEFYNNNPDMFRRIMNS